VIPLSGGGKRERLAVNKLKSQRFHMKRFSKHCAEEKIT
jgi:hypothetical protein